MRNWWVKELFSLDQCLLFMAEAMVFEIENNHFLFHSQGECSVVLMDDFVQYFGFLLKFDEIYIKGTVFEVGHYTCSMNEVG